VDDDIRVRANEAKRKQRKKEKNGSTDNKSVVSFEVGNDDANDDADDDYFEDPEPFDESASFYSMKLSRPLLKAIENAKYSHPTPIQVSTILNAKNNNI
jgi:ATP-dependent RNA helicase DDX27